jgi:hypothetical protein
LAALAMMRPLQANQNPSAATYGHLGCAHLYTRVVCQRELQAVSTSGTTARRINCPIATTTTTAAAADAPHGETGGA